MMPHPVISAYTPATGRAIIAHGEHLSSWMSVDDLFAQAFAWFDVARELRARNLAVGAVEALREQTARDLHRSDTTADDELYEERKFAEGWNRL